MPPPMVDRWSCAGSASTSLRPARRPLPPPGSMPRPLTHLAGGTGAGRGRGRASVHRAGVTTIHEMVRRPEEADDFAALRAEGELGVRVRLYYRIHESPLSLDWLGGLGA